MNHHLIETVTIFLKSHKKMALSVNRAHGHPSLSLMHYAVGESLNSIYFGTRRSFRKYALLHEYPDISCLITEAGENPLRALSIRGIARELIGAERDLAYALFKQNNITTWYIEGSDDLVMFAIRPTSIHWLDGSSGTLHDEAVPVLLGSA